jgi:hypothetical protein
MVEEAFPDREAVLPICASTGFAGSMPACTKAKEPSVSIDDADRSRSR